MEMRAPEHGHYGTNMFAFEKSPGRAGHALVAGPNSSYYGRRVRRAPGCVRVRGHDDAAFVPSLLQADGGVCERYCCARAVCLVGCCRFCRTNGGGKHRRWCASAQCFIAVLTAQVRPCRGLPLAWSITSHARLGCSSERPLAASTPLACPTAAGVPQASLSSPLPRPPCRQPNEYVSGIGNKPAGACLGYDSSAKNYNKWASKSVDCHGCRVMVRFGGVWSPTLPRDAMWVFSDRRTP